jgi:hypothetical protein
VESGESGGSAKRSDEIDWLDREATAAVVA